MDRNRVVDADVSELMTALPALAIEGAKGVGKTATASRRAATIHRLDDPAQRRIARVSAPPKHHLVDPALAARLLGVDASALLDSAPAGPPMPRDGTLLGALFESLVTLSVRVYAQQGEATVKHLRTAGGEREIDLIVEHADGRVVALEVKLARDVADGDVRHLRWLTERVGDDLLDAVVVTTGSDAYRRRDGIAVVPAALLGP